MNSFDIFLDIANFNKKFNQNSKSKKGHNSININQKIICRVNIGAPFDSEWVLKVWNQLHFLDIANFNKNFNQALRMERQTGESLYASPVPHH